MTHLLSFLTQPPRVHFVELKLNREVRDDREDDALQSSVNTPPAVDDTKGLIGQLASKEIFWHWHRSI